jgi:lipoate-protein ligase A
MERLHLIRRSFTERQAFSTAVSRAILMRVAAGELPATMRLHRPGAEVAFGRQDVASPGYPAAVRAARAAGFEGVERLAGGRAAVFHEGTLAIARSYPDRNPARRTYARFEETSGVIAAALGGLGIDARVGEVRGEYCPGAYSVSARGRSKLVGIGQRMIAGAAHVGVVIVVSGEDRLRAVLEPVYGALGLDWDPETAGSVSAELGRAVSLDEVADAVLAELGRRYELADSDLDGETLALAERLEAEHRSPAA